MDFHTLPRRELQALCKRNKIPANLTNVAMADSLKALESVEGIEEVIARSSIGPRLRLDAPSSYVNMTPVPSGLTSRRRISAKGDSAVTGTRRSARLAAKSDRLLEAVEFGSIYSNHSRKDLFTGDSQEFKISLEDSLDSLDEMSVVTDMEESSEKNDGQVDSADKQNLSTDVEPEATIEEESNDWVNEKNVELIKVGNNPDSLKKVCSADDCLELLKENHDGLDKIVGVTGLNENPEKNSEAQVDSSEKQDMSIDEYLEPSIDDDEGVNMEVKEQGDGSQSFALAGVIANTQVEVKSAEKNESEVEKVGLVPQAANVITELNEGKGAEIDDKVGLGSEIDVDFANPNCDDDAGSEEVSADDDETFDNEDSNPEEDTVHDENEEDLLEQDSTDSSETESDPGVLECTEESTKANDSFDFLGSETSSFMSYEDDNKASKDDLAIEEAGAAEPAANVTAIDQVFCTDSTYQIVAAAPKNTTSTFMENDPSIIIQPPPLLTPQRALSAMRYSGRSKITAASDNKENIGSGSKTAPAKERPKTVKEIAETVPMFDQSLIKNLKYLHITHKSDKIEVETEVSARTALQALPQNKTLD